jgi:hypothetical protein
MGHKKYNSITRVLRALVKPIIPPHTSSHMAVMAVMAVNEQYNSAISATIPPHTQKNQAYGGIAESFWRNYSREQHFPKAKSYASISPDLEAAINSSSRFSPGISSCEGLKIP